MNKTSGCYDINTHNISNALFYEDEPIPFDSRDYEEDYERDFEPYSSEATPFHPRYYEEDYEPYENEWWLI